MSDFITPDQLEPSREEKHEWLLKRGYMHEINGLEFLTSEATARLGGDAVSPTELDQMSKQGSLPEGFWERMRSGAAFMRDIHDTDDAVELLFASFVAEEACK